MEPNKGSVYRGWELTLPRMHQLSVLESDGFIFTFCSFVAEEDLDSNSNNELCLETSAVRCSADVLG